MTSGSGWNDFRNGRGSYEKGGAAEGGIPSHITQGAGDGVVIGDGDEVHSLFARRVVDELRRGVALRTVELAQRPVVRLVGMARMYVQVGSRHRLFLYHPAFTGSWEICNNQVKSAFTRRQRAVARKIARTSGSSAAPGLVKSGPACCPPIRPAG